MRDDDNDKCIYRVFLGAIGLTIVMFMGGVVLGTALATRGLVHEENLTRAQAHFESIVLMRKWVASYGVVYVEKKPGVESNPYLDNPDLIAADGTVYTRRNPAMMTRELAALAADNGLITFNISSLTPLNPANRPDLFEQKALQAFDRNQTRYTAIEQRGGQPVFRYMAPLLVEKECLTCHAAHGYQEGDARGGISVSFNIDRIERRLKQNLLAITASGLAGTLVLLGLILLYASRMIRQLQQSRARIEELAITDELTGLYSRRHAISRFTEELQQARRERLPLSCLLIDLDHFKRINEQYGHAVGDAVLRSVAAALRHSLRPRDLLARFGGEEFLALLPETGREEALQVAERVRSEIARTPITFDPAHPPLNITVSIGISTTASGDDGANALLFRADTALYEAKRAGHNRCVQEMATPAEQRPGD